MSTESNKATLRRYYAEILNKGNFSVWNEIVDKDYVLKSIEGTATGEKGIEAAKQGYANRRAGSSDQEFIIEELVAEGDAVVVRGHLRGTHTGVLQGVPATGKKYNAGFAACYYFKAGKITSAWQLHNVILRYQQLGITTIPAPAAPAR